MRIWIWIDNMGTSPLGTSPAKWMYEDMEIYGYNGLANTEDMKKEVLYWYRGYL